MTIKKRLQYFVDVADQLGGIALIPNPEDEVIDSSTELTENVSVDADDDAE